MLGFLVALALLAGAAPSGADEPGNRSGGDSIVVTALAGGPAAGPAISIESHPAGTIIASAQIKVFDAAGRHIATANVKGNGTGRLDLDAPAVAKGQVVAVQALVRGPPGVARTGVASVSAPVLLRPDLALTTLEAPEALIRGAAGTFRFRVREAAGDSGAGAVLRLREAGSILAEAPVAVGAGATQDVELTLSFATAGVHALEATVEGAAPAEAHASNNSVALSVAVTAPPDLAVSVASAPGTLFAGAAGTFTFLVSEIDGENGASGTFRVREGESVLHSRAVAVAKGASTTVEVSLAFAQSGAHALLAEVVGTSPPDENAANDAVSLSVSVANPIVDGSAEANRLWKAAVGGGGQLSILTDGRPMIWWTRQVVDPATGAVDSIPTAFPQNGTYYGWPGWNHVLWPSGMGADYIYSSGENKHMFRADGGWAWSWLGPGCCDYVQQFAVDREAGIIWDGATAVDACDGTVLGSVTGNDGGDFLARFGDYLYFAGRYGNVARTNVVTGAREWRVAADPDASGDWRLYRGAVDSDGAFVVASRGARGKLVRVSADGTVAYRLETGPCTPPVIGRGSKTFVGTSAGCVSAVKAFDATGTLLWSTPVASKPADLLVGDDGKLYALLGGVGEIAVLDQATGAPAEWIVNLGPPGEILLESGVLYARTGAGLHALEVDAWSYDPLAPWPVKQHDNQLTGDATPAAHAAPAAPAGLVATSGVNGIWLEWAEVAGATGYEVYRGASAGDPAAVLVATSGLPLAIDAAAPSGTHHYFVKALNAAGRSGASNDASATLARIPTTDAADAALWKTAAGSSPIALLTDGRIMLWPLRKTVDAATGEATSFATPFPVDGNYYGSPGWNFVVWPSGASGDLVYSSGENKHIFGADGAWYWSWLGPGCCDYIQSFAVDRAGGIIFDGAHRIDAVGKQVLSPVTGNDGADYVALAGGKVYFSGWYGAFARSDAQTGAREWRVTGVDPDAAAYPRTFRGAVDSDGGFVVATRGEKGNLAKIGDAGAAVFNVEVGPATAPVIGTGSRIFVGTSAGCAHAIRAFDATGAPLWSMPVLNEPRDLLVGDDGKVYAFLGGTGEVVALDQATGAPAAYVVNLGSGGEMLLADGVIYAKTANHLYALPVAAGGYDPGAPWPVRQYDNTLSSNR
jgi:hypothetical protein